MFLPLAVSWHFLSSFLALWSSHMHGLLVFTWKAELLLTFSSLYLLFPLPRMLYSQIFLWLTPSLYSDITKILKPLLRFSLTTLFKTAHAWTHVHLYMPFSTYDCMTCIFICFFPQLECKLSEDRESCLFC